MRGNTDVALTRTGTRVGTPLADALFDFLYTSCAIEVQQRAALADLTGTLPCSKHPTLIDLQGTLPPNAFEPVKVIEISFVDDGAFTIMAASPEILLRNLALLADLVNDVFVEHGLIPHLRRACRTYF